MWKKWSLIVSMRVVFVSNLFLLITGGGLLSAETSEDFLLFFAISSKAVSKSLKTVGKRKGQDVTSDM